MIPNHRQFIDAIHEQKRIRLSYYSRPDQAVVDRECIPLDYGRGPITGDDLHRYWIWDDAIQDGSKEVGLLSGQITTLSVLSTTFAVPPVPLTHIPWHVERQWATKATPAAAENTPAPSAAPSAAQDTPRPESPSSGITRIA